MKATDVKEPGYYWWRPPAGLPIMVEAVTCGTAKDICISALSILRVTADMEGEIYGPVIFEQAEWISDGKVSIGIRWDGPLEKGL